MRQTPEFIDHKATWATELQARLPAAVRGVADDSDFGGGKAGTRVRVHTESVDEVLTVLEIAARHAFPVTVRGAGHSSGGQTIGASGVVLEHAPVAESLRINGDLAEVPAFWTWQRLESELRAVGRDLVVATSSLETTVGGTLSLGGFGVRSVRAGPQVDQVVALRLVCANGDISWCSPSDHGDLFRSALTGLGRVGLIDRVRISTRPRHDHLSGATREHPTFGALASYLRSMTEGAAALPDYCSALAKQGKIESFVAFCHRSDREARQRLDALPESTASGARRAAISTEQFEAEERAMPLEYWRSCRNLWCDYCFTGPAFAQFAGFVDSELSASLRGHLAYVMSIAPRRGEPFALDMRPASNQQLYSIGLFYSVPKEDAAGVARAAECHVRALDECSRLGGRPYLHGLWGGASGLSRSQLTTLFGSEYERLNLVRRRVDPLGLLNPFALSDE
jgi:FAD/FMN-containing dehydrogenase